MPRVVVIGAGIAGLTLAYRLRAQLGDDCEVVVFEQSDRVGGYLRSEQRESFLIESGPNGFLDNAPDTLALVGELGLRSRLTVSHDSARRRFVFRDGRLHLLPGSPSAFLGSGLLSLGAKLRIAAEPFARRKPDGDETIHAFAARRLGREAADVLIDPMVSGVVAGDARQLSLRATFHKIWELEDQHGGLLRALIARRRARWATGAPVGSPLGRLTSFAGGIETLPLALAAALGDRVQTRVEALGISPAAGAGATSWRIVVAGRDAVVADHVVLAVGPAVAGRLVGRLDQSLASRLTEIPSAPLAVVALGFDLGILGHPLDGFGFLVPRREGPRILGALWESSVFSGRAPGGQGLVRVIAGGAHDPGFLALDDHEMLRTVRRDLQTVMGVTAEPRMTRIIRHPAGIPQYTVGHLDRMAQIDAAVARLPGLHLTGHGYRGVGINHGITDASALATRLAAAIAGASRAA